MKLVLQIALGIVLGFGLIAAAIYSYNWYNRPKSDTSQQQVARDMLYTTIELCDINKTPADKCMDLAIQTCDNFHQTRDDCKVLIDQTTEKLLAEKKAKVAK